MIANVSKLSYDTIQTAFERFNGELVFEKYGKQVSLRVEKTPVLSRALHTRHPLAPDFLDAITFT